MDWNPDAVILANGSFPRKKDVVNIINNAGYVACCDAAARRLIDKGRMPDVIVGDGDSMGSDFRTKYSTLVHIIGEQETNDMTKTFNFVRSLGKMRIAILGGTGKREDHTLGNISLLMEYSKQGVEVRMFTDYGVFIPCQGSTTVMSHKGQQVSVFNFGAKGMKSEGLAYSLYDFSNWWQGTLNESLGERFSISAEGPYLLFLNY